jgi:membrane associated rhomboid family serine protease/Flp pilus assembly protein TadD
LLTCEVCGKQFERQSGGGNLSEGGETFKCPECAAKSLESTPTRDTGARVEAAQLETEINRLAPTRPVATYALIAVCTAVFVFEIIKGAGFDTMSVDLARRLGADYGPLTLGGQWWRLITSMFLHFGFLHLLMNMFILWALGGLAERLMGRAAFLLLYFATGLFGGLLSLAVHPQVTSAGASGAVFGITGGLVTYLALKKAPLGFDSIKKQLKSLGIFIAYNLIYSLRPGVDLMAHAGGLGSGLIIAALLPRFLEAPDAPQIPAPFQEKSSVNKRVAQIGIACAVAVLLAAFTIHRQQADSIYVLASLDKIDAGQSTAVIPTLEQIAVRQPDSYLAHFALGAAYLRTSQLAGALRELHHADDLESGHPPVEQELAAAYLAQNDFANAIIDFRAALAHDSNNPSAHLGLAEALLGNHQYQEARTEASTVLASVPKDPNALGILGQAEIQLGATDDGLHDMETALQLAPNDSELRGILLAAYASTGHKTHPPLP